MRAFKNVLTHSITRRNTCFMLQAGLRTHEWHWPGQSPSHVLRSGSED